MNLLAAKQLVQSGHYQVAQTVLQQTDSPLAKTYSHQIKLLTTAQKQFNQQKWNQLTKTTNQLTTAKTLPKIKRTAQHLQQLSQQIMATAVSLPKANYHVVSPAFQNVTAGILVDQATGQILWQKNAQVSQPVASISKLLAVLTVAETLKKRHLSWQTPMVASSVIAGLEKKSNLSSAHLQVGARYTVQQLLQAAMLASANDAIMVIGQNLYGSQARFVQKMLQQAQKLHLTKYQIVNANGLPRSIDKAVNNNPQTTATENELSAVAVAKITQKLLQVDPQILNLTKPKQMQLGQHELSNTNQLVPGGKFATKGYVVDGLKTGTGNLAGAGLVATAKIHQRRVILVVLHATNDDARFNQAIAILNFVQAHLQLQTILTQQWSGSKKQRVWTTNRPKPLLQGAYHVSVMQKNPKITVKKVINSQKVIYLSNF